MRVIATKMSSYYIRIKRERPDVHAALEAKLGFLILKNVGYFRPSHFLRSQASLARDWSEDHQVLQGLEPWLTSRLLGMGRDGGGACWGTNDRSWRESKKSLSSVFPPLKATALWELLIIDDITLQQ